MGQIGLDDQTYLQWVNYRNECVNLRNGRSITWSELMRVFFDVGMKHKDEIEEVISLKK